MQWQLSLEELMCFLLCISFFQFSLPVDKDRVVTTWFVDIKVLDSDLEILERNAEDKLSFFFFCFFGWEFG